MFKNSITIEAITRFMNSGCTHRIIINLRGVYCKTRRNSMHIFTSRKYRFLGNVFFHAVIYGKTHVIQSDVFGVMGVKTVYSPFRQAASHTGAQIKNALRPVSALFQLYGNIAEGDIADIYLRIAVEQNSVFTDAVYIFKGDVLYGSDFCFFLPFHGSNGDWLCLTPPVAVGKLSGVNVYIGERNIFHISRISELHGDSSVGTADDTILHRDIPER